MHRFALVVLLSTVSSIALADDVWRKHAGKPGPSGWRCHVIQPDPNDHGPDGFNHHDWDGDGDLDVLVNFEEGGYSRLYFNPGREKIRQPWTDYIALERHGNCEDSGSGDLDNDGDIDYIANGGHDIDSDGDNDLLVQEPLRVEWEAVARSVTVTEDHQARRVSLRREP